MENENLESHYAIPEEWINYGDVNPKLHGGIFVKWERDMWEIIQTTNKQDLPGDIGNQGHMFKHMWLEPMEIWIDGNPYNGFTTRALKGLDEFSTLPFEVMNSGDIPESEKYQDYVDWYISNHMMELLGNLTYVFTQYLHGDHEFSEDYWGYLEGYDINQDDF